MNWLTSLRLSRRLTFALLVTLVLGTVTAAHGSAAAHSVHPRRGWVDPPSTPYFQYQLQTGAVGPGGIDVTLCASTRHPSPCSTPRVMDLDLYGPDGRTPNRAAVHALHARGAYAICYVDAGTWESWRPDAGRFPRSLLGRANGWPGERWLDIRRVNLILPLLTARVAACARAGFNGVEFDNVDGFENTTGFALTSAAQLRFNRDLAALAHRYGLAAGLKNDPSQVGALATTFDFAIDEQCEAYQQCGAFAPFIARGHSVFDVEYRALSARVCDPSLKGLVVVTKQLALRARPWGVCA